METELGVLVDRLVEVVGGLARVFQLEIEITDAVVDAEVRIGVAFFFLGFQYLQPGLNRAFRVLPLEGLGAVLELLEFRHGPVKIRSQ